VLALAGHGGEYLAGHNPPDFIGEGLDAGIFITKLPQASLIGVSNDLSLAAFYRRREAGFVAILRAASRKEVYDLATLWLKNEGTTAKGQSAILSELWAEFVGTGGRSEQEVQVGLQALETIRTKVRELPIDELRRQFQFALPPTIDDFFAGQQIRKGN
jgi:hypothetical protein